ncbi:MAG: response regulator [Parasulfuritortus sp.]|nr:response regulator [Parasulfuritortus sp.]
MSTKNYLTPNEAAELLMVAPATLRVWSDKGLIKARTTAGGHRRFMRDELERFQREQGMTTRSQRILIVDDEPALTRYLSALLSDFEGIATATAWDGFSAGQLVQSFRPHVILLDLMMTGMDGFQSCQQIKAEPSTRAIRVIAMTGYPSPENVERILAAGAEACLSKPVNEDQLLAMLKIAGREGK